MSIFEWLFKRKLWRFKKALSANNTNVETDVSFLQRCINQEYFEVEEFRDWNTNSEFKKILEPLNNGDNLKAIQLAKELSIKFNDFGLIYKWWAIALIRINNLLEAKEVIKEGLRKSKSKFDLCNLMGEIESKVGNIDEAIYWWAQGLHCQRSLPNNGNSIDSFLFLYYVSQGLGLSNCAQSFILMVDLLKPGQIRLSTDKANSLIQLTKNRKNDQIINVIHSLVDKYLSVKKSNTNIDSSEVDKLIKIALDRNNNARTDAIKKLGDIGDKRAIAPLKQIYDNELGFERFDAKDAIDKILGK